MLKRWRYNLSIYTKLQLLHIRAHMEYRLDFFIGVFGAALKHFSSFVFIWALFSTVPQVNGWSLWEIAFLYGLLVIPQGLVEVFCDGQWRLRFLVNTGELDRLMLRSISPALNGMRRRPNPHKSGKPGWAPMATPRPFAVLKVSAASRAMAKGKRKLTASSLPLRTRIASENCAAPSRCNTSATCRSLFFCPKGTATKISRCDPARIFIVKPSAADANPNSSSTSV